MPSPFTSLRARSWSAKSSARRLAEQQFVEDRSNAHVARESWKTTRQLMHNDLANAMESEDMVSRIGPSAWNRELFTLGALNNRLDMLSAYPSYNPMNAGVPLPAVGLDDPSFALSGLHGGLPLPGTSPAILAPAPAALPVPVPVPMPMPMPMTVPGAASLVNDIPISVGPHLAGYSILNFVGPVEGAATPSLSLDVAIQRLAAVELLVTRAAAFGGNGVVNLRIAHDAYGNVVAVGDAVTALPVV